MHAKLALALLALAVPSAAAPTAASAALPSAPQDGAADAPEEEGDVPVVQEVGDFYVLTFDETKEGGVDLEMLTKLCQEATGINFMYDDTTASELSKKRVRMFGQKRIPKADFYSFYQILMFINDFVCTQIGSGPLAVVVLRSIGGAGGRPQLKNDSIYVLPEDLDKFADQVATPITTVLHLDIDARQLTNSLRSLLVDTNSQSAIPVGNTNSLILQGYASQIVALARFLELVDREMARDESVQPVFEVVPLEFAAAEDVADILEQLLEAATRLANQNQQAAQAQGATGTLRRQGGETRILTYARTNALLIMALPQDMQNIKELIARLDVDVIEPERTYHIVALDNVQAEEVAEVLEDFISDAQRVAQQGAPGAAQGGQPARGTSVRDSEIVVVPDPVTNSLLIAASKSRYAEVLDLIRSLDQRQDQVLIETALIELSDSDQRDIGVELGFADIPGSGTGGFGVTQFGFSQFVDSDGDGIPDIRVPGSNFTGLSAGILDGDDFNLPILIQAIQERRTSNVLNVPSVLVNNNSSATVVTLDEQPTATITVTGATGTEQTTFNGYEEAGITMQISPSISASGYLRLNVYLEVSSFLGAFSPGQTIPPPRVTRTLQTQVNVPDGDTMVIGGIITDNTSQTRTSLPWLGNMPVLGALFRRDADSTARTTLYFFVTPHILADEDFADLAEKSYEIKLEAAEVIGANRIRVIDPTFGQADHGVDLSGFDVPLYKSPQTGEVRSDEVGLDSPAEALGSDSPEAASQDSRP